MFKTALLAILLTIAATARPVHAQSPYPSRAEQEARDELLRRESEAIGEAHRARERKEREAMEQQLAKQQAAIDAMRAKSKAIKEAEEAAKVKATEDTARDYERYNAEMEGQGRKLVLSALVCIANAKHNEFLAYIRQDNKYARAAGVVNLRQRDAWKDELQHWDMVATLAKRDGGKAACRSKLVACLLSEDCESPHAWLFSKAWEEYTMRAYQEVP